MFTEISNERNTIEERTFKTFQGAITFRIRRVDESGTGIDPWSKAKAVPSPVNSDKFFILSCLKKILNFNLCSVIKL